MNDLIKISNINKTFEGIKKIKVLKKITFNFKKGKIYSLMGPSGSGKSTILKILAGLILPTKGEFRIFGEKQTYH